MSLVSTDFSSSFCTWLLKCVPGPVYMINMFGTKIVVLNTFEAAQDLLHDRFKDYSERPPSVMVCDLYVSHAMSRDAAADYRLGWDGALISHSKRTLTQFITRFVNSSSVNSAAIP